MFKNNPLLNEYYDKMVQMFKSFQTDSDSGPKNPDYSTFKVTELKAEAKSRGFKGYTRLKKSELIDLLNQNQ